MLIIENDGQAIKQTTYWDSETAVRGFVYLSWNAGAGRVLLPDSQRGMLTEMRGAEYVIVSRGPWAAQGGRDALELLFEDGSDAPFCLHLVAEQRDKLRKLGGSVWVREKIEQENAMRVITYQAPSGGKIYLTQQQADMIVRAGYRLKNRNGEEYCTVAHGLHMGEPTWSDKDIDAMCNGTYRAPAAIIHEGDQYVGEFSVETAPTQFLSALVMDALHAGEARAKDGEGCEVTAVAVKSSN